MQSFPKKINTSPMLATKPNLAGFLIIKKNASFADVQKPLPCIAIFLFINLKISQLCILFKKKVQKYLDVSVFI